MTILDVLEHIDQCYHYACERPQMYSRNPQAMEDRFVDLELLREYMVLDGPNPQSVSDLGYFTFLKHRLPDVSANESFVDLHKEKMNNNELFRAFSNFWQEYLKSEYRKPYKAEP